MAREVKSYIYRLLVFIASVVISFYGELYVVKTGVNITTGAKQIPILDIFLTAQVIVSSTNFLHTGFTIVHSLKEVTKEMSNKAHEESEKRHSKEPKDEKPSKPSNEEEKKNK